MSEEYEESKISSEILKNSIESMKYDFRSRAGTRTEEEWSKLMQTLTGDKGGRKATNLTFHGSFGPSSMQDGSETSDLNNEAEALLRVYKKKLEQDVFNKNIILSFEQLFEAGYLYKYLSIVWQQLSENDDEKTEENDHSKNLSYNERKTSFMLKTPMGSNSRKFDKEQFGE